MSTWQLYWITRLDGLVNFFEISAFATLVLCGACIAAYIGISSDLGMTTKDTESYEGIKRLVRFFRNSGIALLLPFLISTIGALFLPSKKDIAIILAGHWATHNKEMIKLPENVIKTLNDFLE